MPALRRGPENIISGGGKVPGTPASRLHEALPVLDRHGYEPITAKQTALIWNSIQERTRKAAPRRSLTGMHRRKYTFYPLHCQVFVLSHLLLMRNKKYILYGFLGLCCKMPGGSRSVQAERAGSVRESQPYAKLLVALMALKLHHRFKRILLKVYYPGTVALIRRC